MGTLKAKTRKALPKSDFAIPEKAPGPGSYPMPDQSHAESALSLGARHASSDELARIKRKARSRFPGMNVGKMHGGRTPSRLDRSPRKAGGEC